MPENAGSDLTLANAVFLSYASQDSDAARRICEALRAGGIEVWFDQSELRGGDAWDQKIRRQIRECALFIPVISANTQARLEGYFRREWRLAVDRTHDMAAEMAFLVPVVIDNIGDRTASVPEEFRAVQWTRLPGGDTPRSFAERVAGLLATDREPIRATSTRPASSPAAPVAAAPRAGKPPARFLWLLTPLAILAIGYLVVARFIKSTPTAPPATLHAPPAAPSSSPDAVIPEKSIAVLPFVNMSSDKEQEFFSDGLAEELIDLLTQVSDLRVPARTSSFYFKGRPDDIAAIAQRLRVAHVLEGSVRKAGNRLRITAQLIRADSGYHIWSETYDRDAQDVFKVQDDIAAAVVGVLKVKLLSAPDALTRQTNPEAYSQYLWGRKILEESNWTTAHLSVDAFRRALQYDPDYAPAWAGLSAALDLAAEEESVSPADWQKGKRASIVAADKAVALAPDLTDGYISRGFARAWVNRDFAGAASDYQKALALEPESPKALQGFAHDVLMPTGRLDEALGAIEKALKSDPLNAGYWRMLGAVQWSRHQCPASIEAYERSLALNSEQSNTAAFMGYCLLSENRPEEARKAGARSTATPFRLQTASMAEYALGRTVESEQLLEQLIAQYKRQAAYQIAQVYAWRGDRTRAFEWLQIADLQRDGGLTIVKVDPLMDKLRGDPQFSAVLKKMNLPE